jgi:hypothetical protein
LLALCIPRTSPSGLSPRMEPGALERSLVALSRAEVRFLVVGGVACALNDHVRVTDGLDLLVDAEPANVRRLIDVLTGFGSGCARELMVEDFSDEEGAVRLVEDFPIDMFTRMGGRRYADMLRYRKVFRGEADIPYVDIDGLILLKSGSVRPQDQIDVAVLTQMKKDAGAR